jgi:hypothetical protein
VELSIPVTGSVVLRSVRQMENQSSAPAQPNTQDADPTDGRDETASERYDRNWTEILQEFRVTQTGTQIISGFLLTLAFQQRFAGLEQYQIVTYLILVMLAATTTVIGLAPVSLHRVLFRRHEKRQIVTIGNALLVIDLVFVSLLTGGVAMFILSVVADILLGLLGGAVIFLLLFGLLVVLPQLTKRSQEGQPPNSVAPR